MRNTRVTAVGVAFKVQKSMLGVENAKRGPSTEDEHDFRGWTGSV